MLLQVMYWKIKVLQDAAGIENNGDFHAHSRFARSTIPEEKWGTTRSLSVVKQLI